VRNVRRRGIPSIWSKEEAKRIIDAVNTAGPTGKRDMAILLMISRLGMRQSDVVNLRFDNINWSACTLTFIQVKTNRPLTLPLPDDVGSAVIEYLKHGRPPVESSYVFVKHVPPFDPLKSVFLILDKHITHAGIVRRPGKQKGSHVLRHSLASRLLDNDVPVETIAAILGHADTNQTYDYLKVGFKALAECAIDPEEVMGNA
jgi:integrase